MEFSTNSLCGFEGGLHYGFIPIIGKAATRHIGHAAAQIEPPAIAAEGPSKSTLVV